MGIANCGIRGGDKGIYSWMLDTYGDRGTESVLKMPREIMGRDMIEAAYGCCSWRSRETSVRIIVGQFQKKKKKKKKSIPIFHGEGDSETLLGTNGFENDQQYSFVEIKKRTLPPFKTYFPLSLEKGTCDADKGQFPVLKYCLISIWLFGLAKTPFLFIISARG